jgi:hypothetical protein
MGGAGVAELVHGEPEVELVAIVAGQIGESFRLENTAMEGEPESGTGARTLHVMAGFLEIA